MNGFTIYKHQTSLANELRRLSSSTLSPENKKAIEEFGRVQIAKGCTNLRVVKLMYCLRTIAIILNKDFDQATKTDVIKLVTDIDLKDYSEYTKCDFKIILKMFFKWFKGNDEEFPEQVKWLRPKLRNEKHKLPEELLTVLEVEKLALATTNPRDKALVLVLYESGCRIGELLYLRIKHVQFDNYGAVLLVNGKTGSRRVRIIASCQVLSDWLQNHPDKENPSAPLWPARLGRYKPEPCSYPSLAVMLKRAEKLSGIKKRVYPHLFRHSRATALANKLTEAQMKEYFGWTQGSDMASVYVHLSGRDVDSTLLQMYSLKELPIEKQEKLDIKTCSRCKEGNSPTQSFCGKCGNPLNDRLLLTDPSKPANDLMNALFQNPEVKEFIARKVVEMGLEKQLV